MSHNRLLLLEISGLLLYGIAPIRLVVVFRWNIKNVNVIHPFFSFLGYCCNSLHAMHVLTVDQEMWFHQSQTGLDRRISYRM
jgi:hypothetical protein